MMKKLLRIIVLSLLWCNSAIALPKCIGEDTIKWTMCEGAFTYLDGSIYVGEWKDGSRHGNGTLTYEDGREYIGGWRIGLHHGQGTFTYLDGSIYIGGWMQSERHGQGTLIENNGKKYTGQFRNDKFIE